MKPSVVLNKQTVEDLSRRINDIREPEDDWRALLKALITQIMDDYVRLQHPSRRDQAYLKEAFCASIAALWDKDYTFTYFKNENDKDMSFREIMAHRFGLENLSLEEIHKINLGPLQEEIIKEAKNYWIDKMLQVVNVPDFFIFDGRAFSIWRTDEESKIDYEEMIIYLEDIKDERELNETFTKMALEIVAFYRDIKIKQDVLESFSSGIYDLLRLNSCFRQ